jgi:hypothetical protein
VYFYASTEGGLLWHGHLDENKIVVDARAIIAAEGGAILDLNQGRSYLAAAAHDIFLFEPAR